MYKKKIPWQTRLSLGLGKILSNGWVYNSINQCDLIQQKIPEADPLTSTSINWDNSKHWQKLNYSCMM